MTIALGILADDGLVLAADTEETYGGYAKLDHGKIQPAAYFKDGHGQVAWTAGAGHSGYIDAFTQTLGLALAEGSRERRDPALTFKLALREFYADHVLPFAGYPAEERPDFESLIAYVSDDDAPPRLFQTSFNALIETQADRHAAVGAGGAAARAMLKPLLAAYGAKLSVRDAALMAGYVLHRVKESVPQCGKRSDIFVLQPGHIIVLSPAIEKHLNPAIEKLTRRLEPLVFRAAIGSVPDDAIQKAMMECRDAMSLVRTKHLRWEVAKPATRPTLRRSKRGRTVLPPSRE
jgi:20S proteasome alpha/beta subunit